MVNLKKSEVHEKREILENEQWDINVMRSIIGGRNS